MIPSKFEQYTRCYGGGGGGGSVKPPKPPSPTSAAENLAKSRITERTRAAKGYGSTLIGSMQAVKDTTSSGSLLKQLLGQ